jgi:hypothetical protein
MKIRFLPMCAVVFVMLFTLGCKPCALGVKFGVYYGNQNDTVRIFVNDTLIAERVIKDSSYFYEATRPGALLTTYCATSDSFHVRVTFNDHDTSFYIRPKEIGSCFVGNTIRDSLTISYSRIKRDM